MTVYGNLGIVAFCGKLIRFKIGLLASVGDGFSFEVSDKGVEL